MVGNSSHVLTELTFVLGTDLTGVPRVATVFWSYGSSGRTMAVFA